MKRSVVQLSARALFGCSRRGNEAVFAGVEPVPPFFAGLPNLSSFQTAGQTTSKTFRVLELADRFFSGCWLLEFRCFCSRVSLPRLASGPLMLASLALCAAPSLFAADLGSFEGQTDIGHVTHSGSAEFDPTSKSLVISGGGENMWSTND